jgi:GNAT superfamily N-acetyltransferase
MSVPSLDDDARRRALDTAADARRIRADWKARIGRGEVTIDALLDAADQDPVLAGMRVVDALGALPGVGPIGVERLLERCAIAPSRRLRGLGQRQRAALREAAVGRAASRRGGA